MIDKTRKQTSLKFGTGDICVNSGHFVNNKMSKVGVVAFSNQAARQVNSIGEIDWVQNLKLKDFPVIMTFTDKESIDVVIEALKSARSEMD